MSTSMYTPSSYTHSHPGYAPLRTHYAFGAVSGLGMSNVLYVTRTLHNCAGSTYHRNPHQSYGSYTPVARISPPYAYVRPQSTLSARFEYNYPTAYITRTFIEATEGHDAASVDQSDEVSQRMWRVDGVGVDEVHVEEAAVLSGERLREGENSGDAARESGQRHGQRR